MRRATLRIEREAVTFQPPNGESVTLTPIVVAAPGRKGMGQVLAIGESEDALATKNQDLVESGKLPGPIRFVQPGESEWWDALLREGDWRKGAGPNHQPPTHGENVVYVVRPLEEATWSRRYIDPLIQYTIARHLPGLARTFRVMRPALHLEVALEAPEEERRFIEQVVRNCWGSAVRVEGTFPWSYRLGELVVRYGVPASWVGLALSLWGFIAVRVPHDTWTLHALKMVSVPVAASVVSVSWAIRQYYIEGLGRTRWQLVSTTLLAMFLVLLCGIPAIYLANAIRTTGNVVYEGTLVSPVDQRNKHQQVLTFEDKHGQEFKLKLRCSEYRGLKPGDQVRHGYERGWLGIPFVRSSGNGPGC